MVFLLAGASIFVKILFKICFVKNISPRNVSGRAQTHEVQNQKT